MTKQTGEVTIENVICYSCGLRKLLLAGIIYNLPQQTTLRLFCSSCGAVNYFPLFSVEGQQEPSACALAVEKFNKQNKKKKEEKMKGGIK